MARPGDCALSSSHPAADDTHHSRRRPAATSDLKDYRATGGPRKAIRRVSMRLLPPTRGALEPGTRTGQPIIISLDCTGPGPALGGCRVKPYPSWRDGLDDALRLSAAMTDKAALAGLPYGGGKTVVALCPGPRDTGIPGQAFRTEEGADPTSDQPRRRDAITFPRAPSGLWPYSP
jgi:hypothetical protein